MSEENCNMLKKLTKAQYGPVFIFSVPLEFIKKVELDVFFFLCNSQQHNINKKKVIVKNYEYGNCRMIDFIWNVNL